MGCTEASRVELAVNTRVNWNGKRVRATALAAASCTVAIFSPLLSAAVSKAIRCSASWSAMTPDASGAPVLLSLLCGRGAVAM